MHNAHLKKKVETLAIGLKCSLWAMKIFLFQYILVTKYTNSDSVLDLPLMANATKRKK